MLDASTLEIALRQLRQFAQTWLEVEPSGLVRETTARILRVHALRAADALQLAAAFAAAERRPASLEMVTLDERLAGVARKEGFTVVDLAVN
jgi:predicted nucleic acid-binding protein